MQFKFEGNQDYQIRAIEAVADLFTGQPRSDQEDLDSPPLVASGGCTGMTDKS